MHPNQIIVESQRKTSQELESRSNEALSAPDVATGNRHPTAMTGATVTAKNINDNIASSTETVCLGFLAIPEYFLEIFQTMQYNCI